MHYRVSSTGKKRNLSVSSKISSPLDFRQKQEEKQISQKFMQDSLNRPAFDRNQKGDPNLRSSWDSLLNNNYADGHEQNASTYQRSYQNYNPRSYSSFDTSSALDKREPDQNENANPADTFPADDERPRSVSLAKVKKPSLKPATPVERSSSSHVLRSRVESVQFNDDEPSHGLANEDEQPEKMPYKETVLPPIKPREQTDENDGTKSRKIRQLQNRLSRQEEEAKKQLSELQSKQSRLENALKLLSKQTSAPVKPRQGAHDDSPADDRRRSFKQQENNAAGLWKECTRSSTVWPFFSRQSTGEIEFRSVETRTIGPSSSSRKLRAKFIFIST